jgi:hypothetical protein
VRKPPAPPMFRYGTPNARPELLGAAGATQERTLFPVSSRPLFGLGYASGTVRAFSALAMRLGG